MAIDVVMPKLGLTMTEGHLVVWLVSDGDSVKRGQALYEIETDKATMEAEAPADGIIKILTPAGETVDVNARVGVILAAGEAPAEALKTHAAPPAPPAAVIAPPAPTPMPAPTARGERKLASPAAKRIARELGINIQEVVGSGEEGRVEAADVQRFTQGETKAPPADLAPTPSVTASSPATALPMPDTRQMLPVTLTTDVDATRLLALLDALNNRYIDQLGFIITYNEVLVHITARALRELVSMNAYWQDGKLHHLDEIDIGVPIEINNHLMIHVVRQADTKSVTQISQELHSFVTQTQAGTSPAQEPAGGVFTITNLGRHNVDSFTPTINPPAVAGLGAGRIVERPTNHNQQIVLRPTLVLSLTVNSQCVDNWQAARFLNKLRTLIETPYLLVAG